MIRRALQVAQAHIQGLVVTHTASLAVELVLWEVLQQQPVSVARMIRIASPALEAAAWQLQGLAVQMIHTANLALEAAAWELLDLVAPTILPTNLAVERALWEALQQRPDSVARMINPASRAADEGQAAVLAKEFRAPIHTPVQAHHVAILEFLRWGNFVEFYSSIDAHLD